VQERERRRQNWSASGTLSPPHRRPTAAPTPPASRLNTTPVTTIPSPLLELDQATSRRSRRPAAAPFPVQGGQHRFSTTGAHGHHRFDLTSPWTPNGRPGPGTTPCTAGKRIPPQLGAGRVNACGSPLDFRRALWRPKGGPGPRPPFQPQVEAGPSGRQRTVPATPLSIWEPIPPARMWKRALLE